MTGQPNRQLEVVVSPSLSATSLRPRVVLKRGRANRSGGGHPWVYSGAVERIGNHGADAEPGELADVLDADGRLIGCGFLNARSQIAVRMLTRGAMESALSPPRSPVGWEHSSDELAAIHAHQAASLREHQAKVLSTLISERAGRRAATSHPHRAASRDTTAFRLVNSEGDGLPGSSSIYLWRYRGGAVFGHGRKRCQEAVVAGLRSLSTPARRDRGGNAGAAAIAEVGPAASHTGRRLRLADAHPLGASDRLRGPNSLPRKRHPTAHRSRADAEDRPVP